LIGQIEGADAPELAALRKSLAGLRGLDLDERLITILAKSAAASVRKEVIIALAARGARQSVPALLKAAEDDTGELRVEALKALGTLADGALAPALVRMASDERYGGERPYIERALVGMGRRDTTPDRIIDVILAALPDSQPATRESLLRVLGRFGGQKSFQVVRAYLEDADPEIRNAAVRVLSDWPDRSPLEDLLAAAGASEEMVTKALALQGVANLVEKAGDMPVDDRAGVIQQALGIADLAESKKLLLSAAARLPSLTALHIATSCLDQTEIVDEAGMAAADIARAVGKDFPKEAQEALAKALERVRSPAVADKIRSVLSDLGLKR
jgi:HEAT repeat protein